MDANVKLILPERGNRTDKEYIEECLIPMTAELHRLCGEFFRPGESAEDVAVDMTTERPGKLFTDVNSRLQQLDPKKCRFSCHPDMPITKGEKRLKIMLSALVYVRSLPEDSLVMQKAKAGFKASDQAGSVVFQLVRSRDRVMVDESTFQCLSTEPILVSRYLPYGTVDEVKRGPGGCHGPACRIMPWEEDYHFQAKCLGVRCLPVVRRFSLSTVYI